MINIQFEHNYQQKVLFQRFLENSHCQTPVDVQNWRQLWTTELSSWHSPYKCLIDVTHLTIAEDQKTKSSIELMTRFFQGFFLRKIAAYGLNSEHNHHLLPFKVFHTKEEAEQELGVRLPQDREAKDFRSNIVLQNFFQQHCIELSFLSPATLSKDEEVKVLKEKMTNNLMQWHSKWTLIVDCSNFTVGPTSFEPMSRMLKFFNGLFMKGVVGYNPIAPVDSYPFPVFRSRHKAVINIESEGRIGGDEAECRSRKAP